MRKILALLMLLCAPLAHAQSVVQVVSVSGTTTASGSITIQNASDRLIVALASNAGSGGTFTSIAFDGSTSAFTTDDAFREMANGGVGQYFYFGAWSYNNPTAASHTVVVTTTLSSSRVFLIEVSGTGVFDIAQSSNSTYGTSATATSGSLTPSASGDLLLTAISATGTKTFSAWSGSFTQDALNNAASPSAVLASAVGSSGSVSASATISASSNWAAYLIAYKASAVSTCTHAGITSSGAIVVPTAGSTVVRLKNGSFGTVDCSTVSYFQPTVGNFGTGAAAATFLTNDVGTNVLTDDAGANTLTP